MDQDPLGKQGYRVFQEKDFCGAHDVWRRDLQGGDVRSQAIEKSTIALSFSEVDCGVMPGGGCPLEPRGVWYLLRAYVCNPNPAIYT